MFSRSSRIISSCITNTSASVVNARCIARCVHNGTGLRLDGEAAVATATAVPTATTTATTSTATSSSTPSTPKTSNKSITYRDVMDAYRHMLGVVNKTPLEHSPRISPLVGCELYLKKEHFSLTGSYKERGALNKLLQLTPEEKARGVICSSAGNHAQAVSHHATRLGIDAIIVMPKTTPSVKVESTRGFGGKVILSGESFGEAFEYASKVASETGRTFIHAFNDHAVVAGQGTVAVEMLEQNPFLDAMVVPIGGGGLIAGMALVVKHINPRIKLWGVETQAMPGMVQSVKAGNVVAVPKKPTMADGIAIERIGNIPLDIIRKHVDDIVLVDETEIASAVLTLLELEKTVVEGSGATGIAALLSKKLPVTEGMRVGVVCTGGNIDMTLLGRIIEKGLVKNGRLCRIRVTVPDVPGQLAKVCNVVAEQRGNIREIAHERAFLADTVGYTQPVFMVETRDATHVQEIINAIKAVGFDRVRLESIHD